MSNRQPYIRIQWFVKRKEGMSPEDFHKYWQTVHADFARNIPGFTKIVKRYTQFHMLPQYAAKSTVLGLPALDFDGSAEMWVEDVDDYANHMSQADIVKMIIEDGANFMGPGAQCMIGYETLEVGEPVPGLTEKQFSIE